MDVKWFFIFFSSFFLYSCFVRKGLPGGSAGKESACNFGDLGSIPGLGRSPGEGKGYPLQYSGWRIVHGVAKGQTRLSGFHFHWKGTSHSRSSYKNKGNTKRRNNKKSVKYFIT